MQMIDFGFFVWQDRLDDTLYSYIRGVLGNKCAGHHNLKTVKIREIMLK
jgi:hypothetical protein